MKITYFLILFTHNFIFAQFYITGTLLSTKNKEIRLMGYNGLDVYTISETKISDEGFFSLKYEAKDFGIGYLQTEGASPFLVILTNENTKIKGGALSQPETIKIIDSNENKIFGQFAIEHSKREQALSAWYYLLKIYKSDTLLNKNKRTIKNIEKGLNQIKNEESLFLTSLPKNSYVYWYLPMRKLVSSVSLVSQNRPEEIPKAITAFRNIDYTDIRLFKSGLFKDVIESHFWLLENSGTSLESVNKEMKISIDKLIENISKDERKLNIITDYLFDLLERYSLFEASEYLALKVLNLSSCTLNSNLAMQLETYRAMKIGNTAPDISFENGDLMLQNNLVARKLSDFNTPYTLVVFGASWCPKCKEEIPQIINYFDKWKKTGLNVLFISLDENNDSFENFSKPFPFISYCDMQKWNSKPVRDYYVFATPSMFILDKNRKIILRPTSVKQVDAWVHLQ